MKSALRILYPAQCLACEVLIDGASGLCGPCWSETPFILGTACRKCGTPLLGEAPGDENALCDDCLKIARPWRKGAAVMTYTGKARKLILSFKHGDRLDLAEPFAHWMLQKARDLVGSDTIIVPVPIPLRRLIKRRYNQAALLAGNLGRATGLTVVPDALIRTRHTPPMEGISFEDRFRLQSGAIKIHPRRGTRVAGRPVLLVDDVMTTGATLAAAADALRAGGATTVDVLTLARVAKDI